MKRRVGIVLLMLVVLHAAGQQTSQSLTGQQTSQSLTGQPAAPLTLDSCLALAKENNADIRISRLEIAKAREVKAQAFTKFFPQVSGSIVSYHALKPILEFGISDIQSDDARRVLQALYDLVKTNTDVENEISLMRYGTALSATAMQPLFAGGRIVNGNRLAQLGIEAAELNAQVSERDVLEEVETTFYLVLGLQAKVATVESTLALLDSLGHTVDVALRAGLVTRSDALQVELKKNEMRATRLQLANGIQLASQLLCQQMGINVPQEPLTLTEQTESIPPLTQLALAPADGSRPEEQLLNLQLQAEELRKKMSIGEALPQVAFGGTYFWGNPVKKDFSHNGMLFATATVPLTQWWETAHKIREHNVTIKQYEWQRDDLTRKMRIEEQQAYNQMIEAQALLASDSSALAMAEENYRLATLHYEAGLATMNDVLQANAMLLQAQNAITDRKIAYYTAQRRLHDLTEH